jgi:hypothetical protein
MRLACPSLRAKVTEDAGGRRRSSLVRSQLLPMTIVQPLRELAGDRGVDLLIVSGNEGPSRAPIRNNVLMFII